MIEALRDADLRAVLPRAAGAAVFAAVLLAAWNYRAASGARAAAAVAEARESRLLAEEAAAVRARAALLEEALRARGSEALVAALEAEAGAAGLSGIDEATPTGSTPLPYGTRERWELRIRRADLGALLRFLERAERAHPGVVVSGLSLRRSPGARDRLDATVVVDRLVP